MSEDVARLVRARAPVWFNDPVAFCNEVFLPDERPREWQPEVLRAVAENPWVAVAACRKAGKTRLASFVVLWFLATRPQSLVVTTAPKWDQLIQSIWADLHHLFKRSLLPLMYPDWQILQTEIRTGEAKWRCIGITSDRPENTEGRHAGDTGYVLVVLDESKGIDDAFFTSMMGMMGGHKKHNRLLAIGTPGSQSGWFYRAFADDRHLWGKVFQIAATAIPRLQEHCETERIRLRAGPDWRQQQLAEFTGADEGTLITSFEVDKAVAKHADWETLYPPHKRSKWRRIVALDPAGPGKDESILTYRYGPVVINQESLPKHDTMMTASETARRAREFNADTIVVDAVGLGEGIADRLRQIYREGTVIHFKAGNKARDYKQYVNKKSEVVFFLKQQLEEEEIVLPDLPKLRSQLCSWTYGSSQRDSRTQIFDPRGDSPDWADSLMLAFSPDLYGGGFGSMHLPL